MIHLQYVLQCYNLWFNREQIIILSNKSSIFLYETPQYNNKLTNERANLYNITITRGIHKSKPTTYKCTIYNYNTL